MEEVFGRERRLEAEVERMATTGILEGNDENARIAR